ncbi:MAG: hypothetical protein ACLQU4_12095 [Limisphaerales bacterium]
MKFRFTSHWFVAAIACIPLSSTLLFWGLQNPGVNDYHPPYRTLWQAYYWVDETHFGWFGLEDWRLEGVNTETAIYLGKFQFYDIPLPAPKVAAIGFAGISTLGLLGYAGLSFLLRHRRHPPNPAPEPTANAPSVLD